VTWWVVKRAPERWSITFTAAFALTAMVIVLLGIKGYRGVYLHRPLLTQSARWEFLKEVDPTWPQMEYLNENLIVELYSK
jgi:hypothetical protein